VGNRNSTDRTMLKGTVGSVEALLDEVPLPAHTPEKPESISPTLAAARECVDWMILAIVHLNQRIGFEAAASEWVHDLVLDARRKPQCFGGRDGTIRRERLCFTCGSTSLSRLNQAADICTNSSQSSSMNSSPCDAKAVIFSLRYCVDGPSRPSPIRETSAKLCFSE
jgi:hypothetical protein